MSYREFMRRSGYVLVAIWMFGVGAVYLVRFSLLVYWAHKDAVDAFMGKWPWIIG